VVIDDAELITLDVEAFKTAATGPESLPAVVKAMSRLSEGRGTGAVSGGSTIGFSRTGLLGAVARMAGERSK
jgi:hypothetical protein